MMEDDCHVRHLDGFQNPAVCCRGLTTTFTVFEMEQATSTCKQDGFAHEGRDQALIEGGGCRASC